MPRTEIARIPAFLKEVAESARPEDLSPFPPEADPSFGGKKGGAESARRGLFKSPGLRPLLTEAIHLIAF